jgi:hypothetical protein
VPKLQDGDDDNEDANFEAAIAASLAQEEPHSSSTLAMQSRPSSPGLANPRTSFGSISLSSQTSKRKLEHGKEVVKGSDTETDDSDSGLEELSFRKPASTHTVDGSRPPGPKEHDSEKRNISLRSRLATNTRKIPYESKRPPKKTYAFSLDSLVQQTKKASAKEIKAAEIKSQLRLEGVGSSPSRLDKAALTSIVEKSDAADEGKGRRVMAALARTEAFDTNQVWHFFDEKPASVPRQSFPCISGTYRGLNRVLNGND